MSANKILTIRSTENSAEIVVKTTHNKMRARLAALERDIEQQKFARFAPFAGQLRCYRNHLVGQGAVEGPGYYIDITDAD